MRIKTADDDSFKNCLHFFHFLWTGVLSCASYRSLSISKLFCKVGGGGVGCEGNRFEFTRYFWVEEGEGGEVRYEFITDL
jgi:hypothetical protein